MVEAPTCHPWEQNIYIWEWNPCGNCGDEKVIKYKKVVKIK